MGIEYYGGPRTLNGLVVETQTFAVGTTGTDFGVISSVGTHTFNIPDASASARGLITTGAQTIAGAKTLVGDLLFTDATYDIGKSGATRPRDGFFSRDITISGTANLNQITLGSVAQGFVGLSVGTSTINLQGPTTVWGTLSVGTGWGAFSASNGGGIVIGVTDSTGTVHQRSGTNAQTLRVYNTYTSATSGEWGEFNWATTSNVLRIGTNKGSAGGSARDVAIVHGGSVVANFLADRFYFGPIADNTATGGNARGQYAIDLQLLKSSATQVASGLYSVAIGVTNVSSGENTIAIGLGNTSSNYDSVTIGKNNGAGFGGVSIGWGNTAGLSGVAIGQSNAANGDTAAAIGNRNTASGGSSFASGAYSLSDRLGQRSHASGRFAANGDAQSVLFVLRNKTTNNTPTTLFLDGSSTRLTIPSGKTMSCQVTVKGIKSDGSAKARFVRLVEITNVGGTTSLDTPIEAIGTDYNPSGCTLAVTAENATDDLQVNITGPAGETWRWTATFSGLEIAYGT